MEKTVDYDTFVSWGPCWLETAEGRRRLRYYAKKKERWTALDILKLRAESAEDKLWAVLRQELLDDDVLSEFACRCAERALSRVEYPDPRSIAAIAAKRAWMRGEKTAEDLRAAESAAWAAAWAAESAAARAAASAAARAAELEAQVQVLTEILEG